MVTHKTFDELETSNPSETEVRNWIDDASIAELRRFCRSWSRHTVCGDYGRFMLQVRLGEAALQPHWSVTPNFWITVIACLAAVGALWFSWRADIRDSRLDQKDHQSGQTVAQPLPSSVSSPSNLSVLKP
ncbi:MAG: hypothetical protein ACLPYZ_18070 [Limisphaerales bacterium]